MKLTKTITLAALVAAGLLAGTALQAQDAPKDKPASAQTGPGQRGRPDFAKALNLTEDQKPKFKEIMQGTMEKRRALNQDASLTPEEKKAKAKAIQEETTKQMKALLTEEQFAKWEKLSQRPRPGAGGPPPAGADKPKADAPK